MLHNAAPRRGANTRQQWGRCLDGRTSLVDTNERRPAQHICALYQWAPTWRDARTNVARTTDPGHARMRNAPWPQSNHHVRRRQRRRRRRYCRGRKDKRGMGRGSGETEREGGTYTGALVKTNRYPERQTKNGMTEDAAMLNAVVPVSRSSTIYFRRAPECTATECDLLQQLFVRELAEARWLQPHGHHALQAVVGVDRVGHLRAAAARKQLAHTD